MAKIFYARVSTAEQNEARQIAAAKEQNADKIFLDKLSGKNMNRPQLQAMLEYIREGDVVIVESYSRLARNTQDLLDLVEKITQKGAEFVSMKEAIDTSTPQGRFMLTIFAALAEFEREVIHQRQQEGINIKKAKDDELKARGIKPEDYTFTGRQPIAIDEKQFKAEVKKWRAGEQTATATMKKLGLKPNTFYRRVKEMGL